MYKNGTRDVGHSANNVVEEKLDALGDFVKGLVDQGAQKVDAIKTKVAEVKDQTVLRSNDAFERTTHLIKAHPIKAVAIAFGAGYIGMRLFRRR
jgi:ElaB/YqjD/DUF883 family membrane-anchored ribosome-binding protein